jgi:hypothetical protein
MAGERLKRFWTLARAHERNSSLRDLFGTEQGLEVRCHEGDVVLKTERVASVADAMNLCEAWKAAYLVQGWNEPSE